LNTCKRVGFSGHIKKITGNMGVEYNHLGEVCESSKQAKGRKFIWVGDNSFTQSICVHEEQVESKKESSKLVQPWRENYKAC
jgi:hypothetical protein